MNPQSFGTVSRDPIIGIACAIAAVGLGTVYMTLGGAPDRLIIVNLAALLIGIGLCLWLSQSRSLKAERIALIAPLLGATLLATALLGMQADGASRWISVAGLIVQPSLLFVPVLVMLHTRRGNGWTAAGLALAIAGTAAQPDRAMAGVLVGSLVVVALMRRERRDLWLALGAATAFVVTLVRPDRGGVSPFVDQILFSSFDVHPLVGVGLSMGALLLVIPAAVGTMRGGDRTTGLVFGTIWSLVVVAAMMGNYPTPLVGYGGSAIIGYLLSVAFMRPASPIAAGQAAPTGTASRCTEADCPRMMPAA
jgi:cell division protein FtsW (lipid II flippase)